MAHVDQAQSVYVTKPLADAVLADGIDPVRRAHDGNVELHRLPTRVAATWFLAYVTVGMIVARYQPAVGPSIWYPPIAIAMAFVLRHGLRWAPGVFVADFAVSVYQYKLGWFVAAVVAGNTVGEVCLAVLLIRALRLRAEFRTATEFLAVMGLSGALAPLIGAGLGNAILVRLHMAHSDDWLMWWIGDATGVIVLLPALILGLRQATDEADTPRRYRRPMVAEYVAFLVASTGLCWWIFARTHTLAAGHNGYLALTFLPVVWSSVRHGPLATAAMIVMIDVTAVVAFLAVAPTAPGSQVGLLDLQLFMIALSIGGVLPALAIDGERRARAQLRRHRDQLEEVVRERTHELTIALERADRANAAKSEFLARISHELRTPMHAIIGFAKIGLDRCRAGEMSKMESYLDRIHGSGKRLLGLLNDLLDLSKLQAGQMALNIEPVDLASLAEQCLEDLRPLASAKGIELTVECAAPGLNVRADRLRLTQVLTNLLSNAIKFSESGHPVTVEIHEGALPIPREPQSAAVIEVVDRGVGVPPEELETIFESFVQSTRTRTGGGGTGLGLPICREIVHAHGGAIVARHNPGGGTRFITALPLQGPLAAR